ncbi:MAG TPA: CotH kinase family protein [Candidatus Limnocylindria bacterium]|nr:CotH kinase family protein [Candidatus Limnocylindria bacterium]
MWKRWILSFVLVTAFLGARAAESKKTDKGDAGDGLFRDPTLRTLRIDVPEANLAALKQGNRDYIRATFSEGSMTLHDVGIRLKGHASFQPVDKKPAFAIKFNEFTSGQEYRGLSKLVLNNSAQDPSFVRELLAGELFREAGVPAARATHVLVELNGRELGFYVLVEPMNKSFLKREFGVAGGNLYEGETKDIGEHLEQENGDDTTQKDLQALAAAAQLPARERMEKLRALLDVGEFASFVAMEMLTASIDGYAFKKNNYRVYHHPRTDKLMFVPHGLDASFGSVGFQPPQDSLVVKALWELPEFQQQFRTRLAELATNVWRPRVLTTRLNAATAKLVAAAPSRAIAQQIEEEAKKLRYQFVAQEQLLATELKRIRK